MDRIERIARIVCGSYRWYELTNGNRYLFLDQKKNPVYYVDGTSGNLFHVIKIDYNRVYKLDSNHDNAVRMLVGCLQRTGSLDELKDSGNDCIKWDRNLDISKIAATLLKELGMTVPEFQNLFNKKTDFSSKSESGLSESTFRRWRIIFEKHTVLPKNAYSMLSSVEELCGDLSRLICYGIVEVKHDLPPKVLADYSSENDSMRVKAISSHSQMIFSFIHELGHRCWYKLLSNQEHSEVVSKFNYMKRKKKNYAKISVDSSNVLFKDGTSFMANGFSDDSINVVFNSLPEGSRFRLGESYSLKNSFDADDIKSIDGELYDDGTDIFPSEYSKSSATEFFAECFAHWIEGDLCHSLEKWIKRIFSKYLK